MGFIDQSKMANSATFRDRVQIAMAVAAVAIQGEPKTLSDIAHAKRQRLAREVLNDVTGIYLVRFARAVAQNGAVTNGAPVSITSSTQANPTVITTTTAHGLSNGDTTFIDGHQGNTAANGAFTITLLTSTTYSIPVLGSGVGTATGTSTKQATDNDIQFTVNSIWNDLAGIEVTD